MAKLYELSNRYCNLINLLEDETLTENKDILEAINDINEEIIDKAQNIGKLMRNIDSDIIAYETEIKRLSECKKRLDNKKEWLKQYLLTQMELCKINKIDGIITLKLGNSSSVNINEINLIPNEYLIDQAPKVNKEKLLKDLRDGKNISGAELKSKSYLKIG